MGSEMCIRDRIHTMHNLFYNRKLDNFVDNWVSIEKTMHMIGYGCMLAGLLSSIGGTFTIVMTATVPEFCYVQNAIDAVSSMRNSGGDTTVIQSDSV